MNTKVQPEHYVNNKEFYNHLVERRKIVQQAIKDNKPKPKVDEYLGEIILNISKRLSYRYNFINYTYRDEMVLDAIENCLDVVDKFDPEKSSNPFGYFTQIAFRAFVRRIQKEKKQQLIKHKMLINIPLDEFIDLQDQDDGDGHVNNYLEFMRENNYLNVDESEKEKTKKKVKLEKFMEE